MKAKWIVGLVALLLSAVMLVACGEQAGEGDTADAGGEQQVLILGVAGAHSGDLASYGLPTVNAAQLVAARFNANGGVLGMQVEVIPQDDQCKPELATNAATRMIADGARVVVGHICSGATKAALPIYLADNVICMSPSATNPPLTQSGDYPNFFRTIASDDAQAQLCVDFALNTLGVRRVAVIHDKGDYGKGFAEFCKLFLEQSGVAEVVLFEGVTPGAVDYSAVVQKIRESGADCVMFGGYHPEASKIVMQMRRKGSDIPFISDDGVQDDTFIKVAGEYAEGVYASGPMDLSDLPMYQQAIQDHIDTYGTEPGQFYPEGYSAALALLTAIQNAGSLEYDAIVNALRTQAVDTPVGTIKFDERGDAEGVGFSMYRVTDGAFVQVD